jgi:MFS family permease
MSSRLIIRFCICAGGSFGPTAGGLILRFYDWRWVSRMNVFLAMFALALMMASFPELNFDREFALRHPPTEPNAKTWIERLSFTDGYDPGASILRSLHRSIVLLKYPALPWAVLTFSIPIAVVRYKDGTLTQILAMFITMGVYMPEAPYYFTPTMIGLVHLAPLLGTIVGSILGGYVCDKCIAWLSRRTRDGIFEPEFRLFLVLPLFIFGPAGCLLFGFGLGNPNWGITVAGFGMGTAVNL